MNWVQRKIYLYNVTFGLYMLDWWERYLFNALVAVLMWFVMYNGTRYFSELFKSLMLQICFVDSGTRSTMVSHNLAEQKDKSTISIDRPVHR
ncbi:unnamed protein product [Arabis nemorensis]|uniref:Uncharacterized protein n=1 Tax=Arabis nemorensis TaxID=586526 RepID=A0A565ANJ7_9BRAS|nr:unnamed protein product [Arabis nemorensis]